MLSDSALKKIGCFIGGVLFGTAGVKVLSSKDAKKVYTNCTAAALRAKDCVMKTATVVVGIILIFNGVSNIWITSRATKAESSYNKQKEYEATFVEDRKEDN